LTLAGKLSPISLQSHIELDPDAFLERYVNEIEQGNALKSLLEIGKYESNFCLSRLLELLPSY
jgi:hypothetical protein